MGDRVGKGRRNAVFFFLVILLCYGWKSVKIEYRKIALGTVGG